MPGSELKLLRMDLVTGSIERRRHAAETLRCAPGRDVRAALPELIAAVWDADATIRTDALVALGALGSAASVALPAVARALDDPDPAVRRQAASTQIFLLSGDRALA